MAASFDNLLEASPEHLKPILKRIHETGMMAGEIFSFEWEQADMEDNLIIIDSEQTKTNEEGKVPISPLPRKTLLQIK